MRLMNYFQILMINFRSKKEYLTLVNAALFNIICPRKMVRKTNKKDNSGKIKLEPSGKTANLRWIKYYTPESIFFRLLLCNESIKEADPKFCPCPEYKNIWANNIICKSGKKLAHIYFRYEQPQKVHVGTRSCIVIFLKNNQYPDELVQRLKSTVTQLGIGKEKFDFHVVQFCYEKISVNPINRNKLKKEIKNHYVDSRLKIRNRIQMNEKNDLMILEIDHNKEANEFSINPIIENRES